MTATDQLLQKHVGDVFPAEVADFPLADAVRAGVVAPLRCRPGAPGRLAAAACEIVGGDFDQGSWPRRSTSTPLNMAAADVLPARVRQQAGHRLRAGVDHAERVAAAMRAIGMKAAAVSGRTPPRELAETLAAYERGEINVLVNAQLLAEGWNAPRATVCMHLAPTAAAASTSSGWAGSCACTARKEAGVVVDFAEADARRTPNARVTVHSLLGVDVYRPGRAGHARRRRRRRRWRRRPPKPLVKRGAWIVPVVRPPRAPRIAVSPTVAAGGRVEAAAGRAARMWAVVAARAVSPADCRSWPSVIAGLQPEARKLFFSPARPRTSTASCA